MAIQGDPKPGQPVVVQVHSFSDAASIVRNINEALTHLSGTFAGGTSAPTFIGTGANPTITPMTGQDFVFPSTPNVACAGGHRASVDDVEYLDGEIASTCLGCGERIVFARVRGGVAYHRVKRLVGDAVALALGGGDAGDIDTAIAERAELRRALDAERAALDHAEELFAIAEHHLQQRLAEAA